MNIEALSFIDNASFVVYAIIKI